MWDKWSGFPHNRKDDNDAVAAFLNKGNKIKQLRIVEKNFKDEPRSKTARFVFSAEDRLTE